MNDKETIEDELEKAGRAVIRAYRVRAPSENIRYSYRVFCDLYIQRQRRGDVLPRPSWRPSPYRIGLGWSREIQWIGDVLNVLEERRRVL